MKKEDLLAALVGKNENELRMILEILKMGESEKTFAKPEEKPEQKSEQKMAEPKVLEVPKAQKAENAEQKTVRKGGRPTKIFTDENIEILRQMIVADKTASENEKFRNMGELAQKFFAKIGVESKTGVLYNWRHKNEDFETEYFADLRKCSFIYSNRGHVDIYSRMNEIAKNGDKNIVEIREILASEFGTENVPSKKYLSDRAKRKGITVARMRTRRKEEQVSETEETAKISDNKSSDEKITPRVSPKAEPEPEPEKPPQVFREIPVDQPFGGVKKTVKKPEIDARVWKPTKAQRQTAKKAAKSDAVVLAEYHFSKQQWQFIKRMFDAGLNTAGSERRIVENYKAEFPADATVPDMSYYLGKYFREVLYLEP